MSFNNVHSRQFPFTFTTTTTNKREKRLSFVTHFVFGLFFFFSTLQDFQALSKRRKGKLERFSRAHNSKIHEGRNSKFFKNKEIRVADNLPPLFLRRSIENNTHTLTHIHTHTHTQETKKKKERIMSRNGPVHLIFFFFIL